jgi:hypothetical protein
MVTTPVTQHHSLPPASLASPTGGDAVQFGVFTKMVACMCQASPPVRPLQMLLHGEYNIRCS